MMLFFDIDGTLLDQRAAEAAAAADFIEKCAALLPFRSTPTELCRRWRTLRERHLPAYLGRQISYCEYHRRRMRDLCQADGRLSDSDVDDLFQAFLRPYQSAWRLFGDVLPTLEELRAMPLGVLSNGNSAQQRLKLRNTGIVDRFSVVLISEDVGFAKPARQCFLNACRRAGREPADCVYVGDRLETDILGSRAAGLKGIWLNRRGAGVCGASGETISSLRELSVIVGCRGVTKQTD